jgi:hypothetical protein
MNRADLALRSMGGEARLRLDSRSLYAPAGDLEHATVAVPKLGRCELVRLEDRHHASDSGKPSRPSRAMRSRLPIAPITVISSPGKTGARAAARSRAR